ncbi:MAG: RNA-dependent RNA polymerase [Partitiviridae sp.]|nr:MAG: RNA-dependent RNA polymerase [Partitiviridae sp.]
MNLQPAETDPIALHYAYKHFGPGVVDDIRKKWHRARLSYDDLVEDVRAYNTYRPEGFVRSSFEYQATLAYVRETFIPKRKLPLYSWEKIIKSPDFPRQKSAGIPHIYTDAKKWMVAENPELMAKYSAFWDAVGEGLQLPDAALFARAQICSVEDNKIRAVWGYPMLAYLEEGRYFYPLLQYLKDVDVELPIGYGFEVARGSIARLQGYASKVEGSQVACVSDWSRFDKTVPSWLIYDCFEIIADMIDFSREVQADGSDVELDEVVTLRRFNHLVDYFVQTPLRDCKGNRYLASGGVPSGSCFTNVADTLVNVIVTRFCNLLVHGIYPCAEVYLGDDGVCFLSVHKADLVRLAECAKRHFGMVLNLKKSYTTDRCVGINFIGYKTGYGGIPKRDVDFLIASFIEPEYKREALFDIAAAALGQMWVCYSETQAAHWYNIIENICIDFDFELEEVREHLSIYSYCHKYLQTCGIDIEKMSLPSNCTMFGCELNFAARLPMLNARKLFIGKIGVHDYWRYRHIVLASEVGASEIFCGRLGIMVLFHYSLFHWHYFTAVARAAALLLFYAASYLLKMDCTSMGYIN